MYQAKLTVSEKHFPFNVFIFIEQFDVFSIIKQVNLKYMKPDCVI